MTAIHGVVILPITDALVARAITARENGEKSSWEEADAYAELAKQEWTQQQIADACKTKQQRVSRFVGCARLYALGRKRPSFWEAYQEVRLDKKDRLAVHHSSATDQWATPQALFDVLNAEFAFDLDVCASHENAKCRSYFTEVDNALARDWVGTCWMNPPYGNVIGDWMRKAYESAQTGATVVCLVPARTDTAWWWDYARFGEIRFLRGRLRFGNAEASAPFPSAVVGFGPGITPCVKWWEAWPIR
jgi:phage N-6-adenine-methyltransferase